MIIEGKSKLIKHSFEGDKEIFTHISDNRALLEQCAKDRKEYDKNPDPKRYGRKIASIPPLVFFNHPEFFNDDKALRRWLNSDEGRLFRTDR